MPPNVLLLTVDSLRADHVGTGLTPNINEYADGGVRFERAYANGYSTPVSFPTILTGTYPDHYGGWDYMSPRRPFVAIAFKNAGYSTAAFHSNPHLRKETNYDTGFGSYNDFDQSAGDLSRLRYVVSRSIDNHSILYSVLRRLYHLFRSQSGSADYAKAPEMNERVIDWLDGDWDGSSPFFVLNHYMDVHYPFYPPEEFLGTDARGAISTSHAITLNDLMQRDPDRLDRSDVSDLRALYRGDVRYTDHYVNELLEALEERELLEETVVVLTSDHGELFGEHSLFGHPPSVYEPSVHVPLIMWGPGIPDDTTVEDDVDLCSLPPTLTSLASVPGRDGWRRPNLLDFTEHAAGELSDCPIVLGDQRVLGAQDQGFRLVWWRTEDCPRDSSVEWELIDVGSGDPVSTSDHAELVDDLRGTLDEYLRGVDQTNEQLPKPDTDADVEGKPRAIGYK